MITYGLQSCLETALQVARRHGGSRVPPLLRMLAAKAACGLSAREYGLYGLHGRPWSHLHGFITKKQTTALVDRINPHAQRPAVEDKLASHHLCVADRLPVTQLHVVLCHDRHAAPTDVPGLTGFRDVAQMLAGHAGKRLILKPRRDALGSGVRFVELPEDGPRDIRGQAIEVDAFERDLQIDMRHDDYLVQGFVVPHPAAAAWGSARPSGRCAW